MANNMFLFSNDLRIQDNRALQHAASVSTKLSLVFAFDARERQLDSSDCCFMGEHRYQYIQGVIKHLNNTLLALNQHLIVIDDAGLQSLCQLIAEQHIDTVFCSAAPASYEQKKLQYIAAKCSVNIQTIAQHTLFNEHDLGFSIDELANTFSKFRRKIEANYAAIEPCLKLLSLPPPISTNMLPPNPPMTAIDGQKIIDDYFSTTQALNYKETRNDLDNPESSTRFSAALAHGTVSARQVWWALKSFEQQFGRNESTYWIGFELLWRDYFHWLLRKHKDRFFAPTGITRTRLTTSFYAQRFKAFCQAQTQSALVNAIIMQLTQTGYISNRARQIAASFFVYELELDWRFGAKFFQMHLIDYDVASNWGNWQYIAGVGCDPRGGRHFNITKQQQLYDPDEHYIKRWQGQAHQAIDYSDMVDWPIIVGTDNKH